MAGGEPLAKGAALPHVGAIRTALALIGLAVLVWLPRGLDLDRAVATDESIWLGQSANFYRGLVDGDLARTYQDAHPGVTTMWAGAIAIHLALPGYADWGPPTVRPFKNGIEPVLREAGVEPLRIVRAARSVIVIFVTLGLVALGWYAIRLFGFGVGLLGGALLALDPCHIGNSQILHVDALASVFAALAAVAWLAYLLDGRRRRDLVVAGVALGLAGLSRTTAMVVVPMMVVAAVIEGEGPRQVEPYARHLLRRLRPLLAVGALAAVTAVVGWPGMWTSPLSTAGSMIADTRELSGRAHALPIFFDGRIFDGTDPGIVFYPTALLWRATPVMLVGVAVAAAVALAALPALVRGSAGASPQARAAGYLAGFALSAVLLLSVSDRKLDRYIVLVFPPLALVAAWGYGRLGRTLAGLAEARGAPVHRAAPAVVALLLLVVTAVETRAVHPYPLTYYNSLLGGAEAAQDVLMIGAGQGFDQLGPVLDGLPDAGDRQIVHTTGEASITYFTDRASIRSVDLTTPGGLGIWLTADYYIWDLMSDQRGGIPPAIRQHVAGLTPVASVRLNGVTYAALYDLRAGGVPAAFAAAGTPVDGGVDLRLLMTALPTEPLAPSERLSALMYLSGAVEGEERVPLRVGIVDAAGREHGAVDAGFRRPDDAGGVFSVRRKVDVPAAAPAGTYQVVAHFGDPAAATRVVLGSVTVEHPPPVP